MENNIPKGKDPVIISKQKINYNRSKNYLHPQSSICDMNYKEQSDTGALYGSAFAQAKVFVCHVQAPRIFSDTAVVQGTADLYELAEGVFTVATNNRVIPITDTDFLVSIVFTFEGIGQIRLSEEEINFCTTNKELDATVIELTDACAKRLQQFGAKFIRVTSATGGDKYAPKENSALTGERYKRSKTMKYTIIWAALSAATVRLFSYGTTGPSGCISRVGLVLNTALSSPFVMQIAC